jgi:hypothetical protein
MITIIIIICLAYIFGAIGYVQTVLKCTCKKHIEPALILLSIIWPLWLIIYGFAFIASEIEYYIHYGHR